MEIEYLELRSRCAYNLWQVRQDKGYSVEALAILSGVCEAKIRMIEDGLEDFDLSVLMRLACELNVDFRCLLLDVDFRPNYQ